ncbi:ABC transporter permease, partial [Streptomyces sp. NPDC001215]
MPEQQPYEPEGAIAGTGMGGAMDLAASEATTLERPPGAPKGAGPAGRPRSLWSDAWRDLRR